MGRWCKDLRKRFVFNLTGAFVTAQIILFMEDDDYRKYGNSRAAHYDIPDPHKCFVCGGPVKDDDIVCPKCGFPQNGDEASQRQFLGHLRGDKIEENKAAFRIGHAFNLLLGLPIGFLRVAYFCWQDGNYLQAEIKLLFGIAFFLIWFFGRKNPSRAFALSLALYTLYTLPAFISNPWVVFIPSPMFLVPHISLIIGWVNFKYWVILDDELKGKNTG